MKTFSQRQKGAWGLCGGMEHLLPASANFWLEIQEFDMPDTC